MALVLSSGKLIWDSFDRYQNAGQARSIMELVVAAGDLMHVLQVERGITVGSIQSYDQAFEAALTGARAKAGKKLGSYKHLIEGIDAGSMSGVKSAVDESYNTTLAYNVSKAAVHSLAMNLAVYLT